LEIILPKILQKDSSKSFFKKILLQKDSSKRFLKKIPQKDSS